jgi:hypothetical protein
MNKHNIHTEEAQAIDYKSLHILSPAFKHGESIPVQYTCDGLNISPPLDIERIPPDAKCLAIIVEDPDAPSGYWAHWLVWNIPVTHHIRENSVHGVEGMNDFRQKGYGGPCPPGGIHRYFFKVYALNGLLSLSADTRKHPLERAMSGHIIAFGEIMGVYGRKN